MSHSCIHLTTSTQSSVTIINALMFSIFNSTQSSITKARLFSITNAHHHLPTSTHSFITITFINTIINVPTSTHSSITKAHHHLTTSTHSSIITVINTHHQLTTSTQSFITINTDHHLTTSTQSTIMKTDGQRTIQRLLRITKTYGTNFASRNHTPSPLSRRTLRHTRTVFSQSICCFGTIPATSSSHYHSVESIGYGVVASEAQESIAFVRYLSTEPLVRKPFYCFRRHRHFFDEGSIITNSSR
eukprot:PhF_6_TR21662/c1_g3_i1/m.30885